MTNLTGSFWTSLCGSIGVPGALTPPTETAIVNNKIHIDMIVPHTLTLLIVDGTFDTEASIQGLYTWGVDGCALGMTRIDWSASWQGN